MAEFKIQELEGTRHVDIHLNNETVWAETDALNYLRGDIRIHSQFVSSVTAAIKSMLANQAVDRPMYAGTGIVRLESSLGGFHIVDLDGESWILERGAYWASDGSVDVSCFRESVQTSVWAGAGPIYLQTRVRGDGKVVLTTRGPVELIDLRDAQHVVTEGKCVIGRTADVSFHVRRPIKSFFGRFTSGEGMLRVFEGTSRVLLNPAPYWRYRVMASRGRSSSEEVRNLSRSACKPIELSPLTIPVAFLHDVGRILAAIALIRLLRRRIACHRCFCSERGGMAAIPSCRRTTVFPSRRICNNWRDGKIPRCIEVVIR